MNKELELRGYCPECLSSRLNKVGFVWSGRQKKQEYRYQDCGRLTIKPTPKEGGLTLKPA